MKVQIIDKKNLNNLADVKVIKRDGTPSSFYAYKIDLVLDALGADEQTRHSVDLAIFNALMGNHEVQTSTIADLFVAGLKAAGHDDLAKQ